jgi:fibronectin type 3 domain-containing protein
LNYQVYCGLAPGSLTRVAVVTSGSYTYNGLTAGTTYYCGVLASDTAGDLSPTSAPASATTAAAPATPTSVIATANSSTNVTVTWTENLATGGLPISGYQIYRGTSATNLTKVASRTATSYVDTTVTAQTTYYYAVQATDTAGDVSAMSATTQVVIPLAEKIVDGRLPWIVAPTKPGKP